MKALMDPASLSPGTDGPTFLDLVWDEAPFPDHGAFVATVTRTAEAFVGAGVLTAAEKDRIVADAARAARELAPSRCRPAPPRGAC